MGLHKKSDVDKYRSQVTESYETFMRRLDGDCISDDLAEHFPEQRVSLNASDLRIRLIS